MITRSIRHGLLCWVAGTLQVMAASPPVPRAFDFSLPLFDPGSAWNQQASAASVLAQSEAQVTVLYGVLCGDTEDLEPPGLDPLDFPYLNVNFDEYAIPIFAAGEGQQGVLMCDYEGVYQYPGPKWPVNELGAIIQVPLAAGALRPAPPQGIDSDGHLVLYDMDSSLSYDFWQATTVRNGECQSLGAGMIGSTVLEAGAADFFDSTGAAINPDGVSSARAMGSPLLAGLILPEDIEAGVISHALAIAIPGPRNLSPDPQEPLSSDWMYPASTTETDFYSVNVNALAAGQRLRLKPTLVDDQGATIVEPSLAPITRLFIAALRQYGGYVVDNAGGLTFYAEDLGTADVALDDSTVNELIGLPPATPLPVDKTRWQLLMERLNEDLWQIPVAYGTCNGADSMVLATNFEVVESATSDQGLVFRSGFEGG